VSIRDANEVPANSVRNTEICIVGAGAAGITLAHELIASRHSVCLVESGDYNLDEETQSLYDIDVTGYPVRENFMSRARYFGGTCNLWAGRGMKLTEFDFEKREWVPNSGWPITYSELQNYYGRAAKILQLPSFENFENVTLTRGLSQPERALFDNDDLKPNISLWGIKPLRFGAAYKTRLARSRNVTVYLNANVTEVTLNPEGTLVDDVKIATLSGHRITLKANVFVLACGGLENARLLLVSRGVQPRGIGNQFDIVGKYFMDHPRTVFGKIHLFPKQTLPLLLAIPLRDGIGQIGVQLSENTQRKERLLNNYLSLERQWSPQTAKAYQSFVHSMKILLRRGYSGKRFTISDVKLAKIPELIYLLAPRELLPHFLYRAFKIARGRFGKDVSELTIVNYCEQAPNPASRVFLSEERDRLNMNRLILDWRVGSEETRTVVRLQELLDQYLRKNNIGFLRTAAGEIDTLSYTDASHHIGTTRMSEHQRNGVVDANCKVHGVENLFIAGSSVFPTCGYANPTWTIVALALRLAAYLQTRYTFQ
jgi:choline dehydrogenase-like flavoprotein